MNRLGFVLAFALAVALTAGIVTSLSGSTDSNHRAVSSAEARGKSRCVRTGGVKWCFSSSTTQFVEVIEGHGNPNSLPADIVCDKAPAQSTGAVAVFECDDAGG